MTNDFEEHGADLEDEDLEYLQLNEIDESIAELLSVSLKEDFKTFDQAILELGRDWQRKNKMKDRIKDLEDTIEDFEAEIVELENDLKTEKKRIKDISVDEAVNTISRYFEINYEDLQNAILSLAKDKRSRSSSIHPNYITYNSATRTISPPSLVFSNYTFP